MNKFGNKFTQIDNVTFHSAKEAARYQELKLLMKAGEVTELILQPRFELQEVFVDRTGKKQRPIEYVADFKYYDNGLPIVEDVKGMKTQLYLVKKKLFLKKYPEYIFLET